MFFLISFLSLPILYLFFLLFFLLASSLLSVFFSLFPPPSLSSHSASLPYVFFLFSPVLCSFILTVLSLPLLLYLHSSSSLLLHLLYPFSLISSFSLPLLPSYSLRHSSITSLLCPFPSQFSHFSSFISPHSPYSLSLPFSLPVTFLSLLPPLPLASCPPSPPLLLASCPPPLLLPFIVVNGGRCT